VINTTLLKLGLIDRPLNLLYDEAAVIIGLIYVMLPFMVLPLYAVFEELRQDLREASQDLGANTLRTFFHITLPLTLPGIIAGCLLVFLPSLGSFFVVDVLGGARVLLVGNAIKNQFLEARDWPFGAAMSVGLSVVMAVLLIAYHATRKHTQVRALEAV
jgi:spermidine/putrescine transport system permease protein